MPDCLSVGSLDRRGASPVAIMSWLRKESQHVDHASARHPRYRLRPLSRSNVVFLLDFAHSVVYLRAIAQEVMAVAVVMPLL